MVAKCQFSIGKKIRSWARGYGLQAQTTANFSIEAWKYPLSSYSHSYISFISFCLWIFEHNTVGSHKNYLEVICQVFKNIFKRFQEPAQCSQWGAAKQDNSSTVLIKYLFTFGDRKQIGCLFFFVLQCRLFKVILKMRFEGTHLFGFGQIWLAL